MGASFIFIPTAWEETGSQGAAHLVSLLRPGLIGAMVVDELTSNYPFVGHREALWIEAQVEGATAHGSMPKKGVKTVCRAARVLVQLEITSGIRLIVAGVAKPQCGNHLGRNKH